MKALFVFGTRPEAVKMAPVIQAMKDDSRFEPYVCVTGQHRTMLDQILDLFNIHPDFDLDTMTPGQDLFDVVQKSLIGLRRVMQEAKPDVVIVQGDTATTLAAAMAAFFLRISVGHIEAGLRTYDLSSPWPEEGNRQMVTRIADFHFAPTAGSAANLALENVPKEKVEVTGNTVIDAMIWMSKQNEKRGNWASRFESLGDPAECKVPIILITGHRRENFGQGFSDICNAIASLAKAHSDWKFVYPVHMNPNVEGPVHDLLGSLDNVHLLNPLSYDAFIYLLQHSTLVLTDSGGIQEEAPSFGKPVLVMRNTTERPEAVDAGTAVLVGTDSAKIVVEVESLIADKTRYEQMAKAHNPFGDGQSAPKILDVLAGNVSHVGQ